MSVPAREASSSTVVASSLSTARMAPGWAAAASAMSSARRHTRAKPSSSSNAPAKVSAATSPRENPATASGRTPRSRRARAQARSTAKTQGCVFAVCDSSSAVPSKHWQEVPGRTASAASNTARAAGEMLAMPAPMPGRWEPWPAKRKATLPIGPPPREPPARPRPGHRRSLARSGARAPCPRSGHRGTSRS